MSSLDRYRRFHVCSAAALFVLAIAFASNSPGFEGRFNDKQFPATALSFVKQAKIKRLFTTDTWASYFVYQLYPQQPSFFDGRSDFYGYKFLEEYSDVLNGNWNWADTLDRYAVDGVVLQPNRAVVAALKQSPRWHLVFDDGKAVVFKRSQHLAAPLDAALNKFHLLERAGENSLDLLARPDSNLTQLTKKGS